ncbi:MAG: TVP38/TMEM64 family protein [Planctomycetota bacterium]
MVLYIFISTLGLPIAGVMTLLAGAIFGFTVGTIAVSFASTIGATGSFLLSRYLFRDWVLRRFGNRLSAIREGIQQDGVYYLFTLRLVPIFPFFVINAAMGLTSMKVWTFYWVSQLGMLAGTMVYVNAGKQLAQIDTLDGILSWKIIVSFALIGIFPLLAKKTLDYSKRASKKASGEQ